MPRPGAGMVITGHCWSFNWHPIGWQNKGMLTVTVDILYSPIDTTVRGNVSAFQANANVTGRPTSLLEIRTNWKGNSSTKFFCTPCQKRK